ncbi:hypothetical protein GHT06_016040 [Daphnia sinensis]|uniref:BPTI/Kunitz inhibitor domain-containing protein n=1 Tax=Daphnia sinensis TaxID=1820382 RepID=A0AAD5KS11_9CRUS|nr:hypothetical protein GHT06_016040 [Daphnia sinensis]
MFTLVILGACLVLVAPQNSPSEDVCSLNREVGRCRASIQAWYFDKASNECKTFNYSGCSGNANNFNSKEACDKRCATTTNPCNLKMDRGKCRDSLAAWYFDAATGQCKPFTYGGCGGNANNFPTQKKCESKCTPPKQSDEQNNALVEIAKPLLDGLDRIVQYIKLLQEHMRSKLNTESVVVDAAER